MRVGAVPATVQVQTKNCPDGLSSNSHSASNRVPGPLSLAGVAKQPAAAGCFALLIVESRFASDAFIILHFDIQGRCPQRPLLAGVFRSESTSLLNSYCLPSPRPVETIAPRESGPVPARGRSPPSNPGASSDEQRERPQQDSLFVHRLHANRRPSDKGEQACEIARLRHEAAALNLAPARRKNSDSVPPDERHCRTAKPESDRRAWFLKMHGIAFQRDERACLSKFRRLRDRQPTTAHYQHAEPLLHISPVFFGVEPNPRLPWSETSGSSPQFAVPPPKQNQCRLFAPGHSFSGRREWRFLLHRCGEISRDAAVLLISRPSATPGERGI